MSWTPGWQVSASPTGSDDSTELFERANDLFDSSSDDKQLLSAIDTYEKALRSDPSNLQILDRLSEANILYGAAYAKGRNEKAEWYRAGIRAAERAMATNEAFRRRVQSGESIGDAAGELGVAEMRPTLLWVTGVSYYFKECLSGLGKLFQFRWMLRTREVMERMLEVDPSFENGAVLFSLGIYHIASPPGAGRDLALSADYLERATEAGPESLLIRWGRAKYFHVRTGDRSGFREDLEWVLAQDPAAASSPYPWNVYFQKDARQLLDEIDRWFR